MAQPPFKIDQLQIQPGGITGTRLINSNSAGALLFTDTSFPSGITLAQLEAVADNLLGTHVLIVGAGLTYTTIQSAINAIPLTSSTSNPYLVLITPGIYSETITIEQDGITLQGLGPANTIQVTNSGANHTILVQNGSGTTPYYVNFVNMLITNSSSGMAAVRAIGGASSNVGSNGFGFTYCNVSGTSGAYSLWATSVNIITFTGGGLQKDTPSLIVNTDIRSTYSNQLSGLTVTQDPVGTPVPSGGVHGFEISNCGDFGDIAFTTTSSSTQNSFSFCNFGNITAEGTSGVGASFEFIYCSIGGDVLMDQGTNAVFGPNNTTLEGGSFTTTNGSSVGGIQQKGSVSPSSVSSIAVSLPATYSGSDYSVALEILGPGVGGTPWITSKTGTGFTINFPAVVNLSLNWVTVGGD